MLLDTLMPYLMPDGTEGGGAAGGEGTENTGADQQGGDGNDAGTTQATATQNGEANTGQPSANKLIKDFAAERGISVEDLLSSYQQLEDAGKTETERLEGERDRYKGEAERLVTELQNLRSESAFLEAAREARARAPKTLFRAYRDALEFDKSGNPTNIADVIAAARDEEPDLFHAATGSSDAGRRGDGTGTPKDINALIRQMASEAR